MRRLFLLVVGTGIGAILLAAYLAVVDPAPVSPEEPLDVALLVAIGLLGAGTWRLWNARRGIAGGSGDGLEGGPPADRPPGGPGEKPASGPAGGPSTRPSGGPSGGPAGARPGGPSGGPPGAPAGPPEDSAGGPGGSAGGPARGSTGALAEGSTGGPVPGPAQQRPGSVDQRMRHDDRSRLEADQGGTSEPRRGSISGGMVERAPERTPANQPLAGDHLARLTEDACRVASQEGRVEPGVTVVRPTLREATRAVLVRSGLDDATAAARLDSGEWTDDRLAASVLSREVAPPPVPLRKRLRRWLFPETVVRERIARAVDAMAETAEARLPAVVGQNAPRPVPVAPPTLEDRQRHSDGSLGRGPPEALHVQTEPEPHPGRSEPGPGAARGDLDARPGHADPEARPGREDSRTRGRGRDPATDDRRGSGHGRTRREETGQGRTGRRRTREHRPGEEPAGQEDGV